MQSAASVVPTTITSSYLTASHSVAPVITYNLPSATLPQRHTRTQARRRRQVSKQGKGPEGPRSLLAILVFSYFSVGDARNVAACVPGRFPRPQSLIASARTMPEQVRCVVGYVCLCLSTSCDRYRPVVVNGPAWADRHTTTVYVSWI
jgi:hypothetical protein